MAYLHKSYNTSEVAYTELREHLNDKGDIISRDEIANQLNIKVVYRYKFSVVVLHLKNAELHLGVEKKAETGANRVLNKLEKILLTGKV